MKQMSSARWSAITVIAPLTAAAFAGTAWWAGAHDPREMTAEVVAVSVTDVAADQVQSVAIDSEDPQVDRMLRRAETIRAKTRRVLRKARQIDEATGTQSTAGSSSVSTGDPATGSPGTAVSQGSVGTGRGTGQAAPAPVPAPAPEPVVVPEPAPAPPADTTTGAS